MNFQFSSFADFMTMSDHGPYVWASYVIVFIVIGVLIVIPYQRQRQLKSQLIRQEKVKSSDNRANR